MREKQRKVLANFDKRGFFLTGTYEDCYLPDDEAACWKDVENYARRVKYATCKRFGVEKEKIRLMLWAARKGEAGRLHMHGFAQCVGMGEADRREWREMLEDLWRRRIPGTREFEPLGTMNVDRMDMKKLLGLSGEGKNGTLGYIYGHSWRLHRLCGLRLLVGAAVPGLGVREGDDLRPGTAARERGRKAGWMGSHRAAGLSDFAAERVCESLHMTDKIKFLRAF